MDAFLDLLFKMIDNVVEQAPEEAGELELEIMEGDTENYINMCKLIEMLWNDIYHEAKRDWDEQEVIWTKVIAEMVKAKAQLIAGGIEENAYEEE